MTGPGWSSQTVLDWVVHFVVSLMALVFTWKLVGAAFMAVHLMFASVSIVVSFFSSLIVPGGAPQ